MRSDSMADLILDLPGHQDANLPYTVLPLVDGV